MSLHDPRAPGADRPLDHVDLGPGFDSAADRRLIGSVTGRRILDLGCAGGHGAVGLALRRARVIAVDTDAEQLAAARALAGANEVAVEFHQAEPAELAFLSADSIDLVLSVTSLSWVRDLDRVFRQVHRVVGAGGHVLLSVPHPGALCADPTDPARTLRSWETSDPVDGRWVHTAESMVTSLTRANFAVDTVLERHHGGPLPATLVVRARKLGV